MSFPDRETVHKAIADIALNSDRLDRETAEFAVELLLADLSAGFGDLVRSWIVWDYPGETARLLYRCAADVPERRGALLQIADALVEHQAHLDFVAGKALVVAVVRDAFKGFEDVPAANRLRIAAEGA